MAYRDKGESSTRNDGKEKTDTKSRRKEETMSRIAQPDASNYSSDIYYRASIRTSWSRARMSSASLDSNARIPTASVRRPFLEYRSSCRSISG